MPKASPKSWHEALSTLQLWVRMGEALWLRHDILWFKRKSFLHKLSLAWLSPKPNYIVGAAARKFAWWLVWTLVWRGVRRSSSSILDSFRAMPNKGYTTFGSAQYHYCILLHIVWSLHHFMFAYFFPCMSSDFIKEFDLHCWWCWTDRDLDFDPFIYLWSFKNLKDLMVQRNWF